MCYDAFQAISLYVSLLAVSKFISYTKDHLANSRTHPATIVDGTVHPLQQKVDLDPRLLGTNVMRQPCMGFSLVATRARRSSAPIVAAFKILMSGKH